MKDESDVDGESPLPKTSQLDEREGPNVAGPEVPERRKFIQTSLIAGASLVTLWPRSSFGASPIVSPTFQTKSSAGSFELDEITVGELQEGMTSGRFTAHSITDRK